LSDETEEGSVRGRMRKVLNAIVELEGV